MSDTVSTATPANWFPTAKRRIVALILLAVALALLASSAGLHARLMSLLPAAEEIIRERAILGVLTFVAFAALSAMLAFVSSAVIVPIGIYVWGSAVSMLLLWLGWILGGVCAYTLSRFFGRALVRALRSGPLIERYEKALTGRASFGLVLLLQLALPSEIPGYLLGLVRYQFWQYLVALALAELPYAVATVYLGASFIDRRPYTLIAVGTAVAVFAGWALHTLHRRISAQKEI